MVLFCVEVLLIEVYTQVCTFIASLYDVGPARLYRFEGIDFNASRNILRTASRC